MATIRQKTPTVVKTTPHLDPINQIVHWFETAVPTPTTQNIRASIGVHFEEVLEMALALKPAGATLQSKEQLTFAADVLNYFQRQIKSKELTIDFDKIDRVALLDALCDQIVTAVGVAHMLGMNIGGALQAVADSNDSKLGSDRKPIFDTQSKISKNPNYRAPDLTPYTTTRRN